MKYLHYGIPSKEKLEGKEYTYVAPIKLFVTNGNDHELTLQYTCAEEDSPLPEIVRTQPHLCMEVDSMSEAMKLYDEVVFPPTKINEVLTLAFATKDGVLFELMEFKK